MVYVEWKVRGNGSFKFKILRSNWMNIWIGAWNDTPMWEWWFSLFDGWKYDSSIDSWTPYSSLVIHEGDIIGVHINDTRMTYTLNDMSLGIAFLDD